MAMDSRTDEAWDRIQRIVAGTDRPEWTLLERMEAIHGWSYLGLQDWQRKPAVKKLWGRSCRLHSDSRTQVERMEIVKGGYSSWHRHRQKHNLFLIDAGRLQVECGGPAGPDNPGNTSVILAPHYFDDGTAMQAEAQSYFVPAGVWHRFVALEYTVALEVYTPLAGAWVDPDDIERRDEGGVLSFAEALKTMKDQEIMRSGAVHAG